MSKSAIWWTGHGKEPRRRPGEGMTMAVSQSQASEFARLLARELANNGWAADEPITVEMLSLIGSMRPTYLSENEFALLGALQQALDDWSK